MLLGSIMEKTDAEAAWQLCADKLADWVRTCWQENEEKGVERWEETTHEDPAALPGLREEGFDGLVGLDYILKWWGTNDPDEPAGELDVIWKATGKSEGVTCYRTWAKLSVKDFILGVYKTEGAKRDANRAAFRDAFAQWRAMYAKL